MRQHHRRGAIVAAAAIALAVTGCGGDDPDASSTAPETTTSAQETTETTAPPEDASTDDATEATEASGGTTPTDSAVGELVEGFPTGIIPVPPDAEVTMSSVVPLDDRHQVTLTGRTGQTADQIVDFYRGPLAEQGFEETPSTLPEGVLGATFSRGDGREVLTLTVITSGDVQQFTIGGFVAQ